MDAGHSFIVYLLQNMVLKNSNLAFIPMNRLSIRRDTCKIGVKGR